MIRKCRVSFSSDPIPWETHVDWYAGRLRDVHCFFYLAADEGGNPIGQVRFDLAGREAVISVSLCGERHAARGVGRA